MGFGIQLLGNPPGSDYCDILLLDFENSRLFETKYDYAYYKEGSRENFESGIVKIDCCIRGKWYIGFKNNDNSHGVNVAVQAVAIVKEEKLVMHQEKNKD